MTCKTCIKHATHFRLCSFTTFKQCLGERPKAASLYTVPNVGLATSGSELGGSAQSSPGGPRGLPGPPDFGQFAQVPSLPFHVSVMCIVTIRMPSALML